jgi:putative ABC transport system ATP-binding protein
MFALLEAQNLVRRNPSGLNRLLDDVSLALQPGDRVAISGPSGSGKTLLLRSLALMDASDGGRILWRGRRIGNRDVPRFRSRTIYFHQRPSLPAETVEAALRQPFALAAHRNKEFNRRRVVERLNDMGRDEKFLEQKVANLSGGEMQIAALVRSVQLDPDVLLLDEPTSAMDPQTAAAVEQCLAAWIDEMPGERALIWVTHDANQARRAANRLLRMDQGRLHPNPIPVGEGTWI